MRRGVCAHQGLDDRSGQRAIAAVRCDPASGLAELGPGVQLPLVGETDVANHYADALYFSSSIRVEDGYVVGDGRKFWVRATMNAPDVNVLLWFGWGELHAEYYEGGTYVVETTPDGATQVWIRHGTYLVHVGAENADGVRGPDLATLLRIAASVRPISEQRWDEVRETIEAYNQQQIADAAAR
jgi:hypothetical protein